MRSERGSWARTLRPVKVPRHPYPHRIQLRHRRPGVRRLLRGPGRAALPLARRRPARDGVLRVHGTRDADLRPRCDATRARAGRDRRRDRARGCVVTAPLLVRALRRERVERTPVWYMRQAGRCLAEYRALREKHGILEIAREPELCARVTRIPDDRLGVGAAVLYPDLL